MTDTRWTAISAGVQAAATVWQAVIERSRPKDNLSLAERVAVLEERVKRLQEDVKEKEESV